MNQWIKRFSVVFVAALVAVVAFSAFAFAQGPDTGTTPTDNPISGFFRGGPGGDHGFGRGFDKGRRGGEDHLQAVADALGMTVEELQAAREEGKTLEEIAAEKGVDLQAVMLEQAQEKLAQAVADGKLTQEEADQILERIQNGEQPGPFGPHRGHAGGPGQDALAEALGMTPEELHDALRSGQTLEEIAAEKGVDLEAVQEQIKADMLAQAQEKLAQAVADGKLTQEEADQILERMQNGEGPGFGPGPRRGGPMRPFGGHR
ncbi:MAG: hypothetical protein D6790_06510 [Caldilineae bacterium]|nr:MAG: hypothetical protein D6790_06510 [Caldilineae bacterium]